MNGKEALVVDLTVAVGFEKRWMVPPLRQNSSAPKQMWVVHSVLDIWNRSPKHVFTPLGQCWNIAFIPFMRHGSLLGKRHLGPLQSYQEKR